MLIMLIAYYFDVIFVLFIENNQCLQCVCNTKLFIQQEIEIFWSSDAALSDPELG